MTLYLKYRIGGEFCQSRATGGHSALSAAVSTRLPHLTAAIHVFTAALTSPRAVGIGGLELGSGWDPTSWTTRPVQAAAALAIPSPRMPSSRAQADLFSRFALADFSHGRISCTAWRRRAVVSLAASGCVDGIPYLARYNRALRSCSRRWRIESCLYTAPHSKQVIA